MMLKSQAKLDMTFGSFYEIYEADKASRLKQSTWETKSHIIRTKILPYFANRKIDEIEVRDVIAWQNELLAAFKDEGKEERYSQDYLRTIQAQLTAIFAHAMKYYNLPKNPSSLAGTIGKEVPRVCQVKIHITLYIKYLVGFCDGNSHNLAKIYCEFIVCMI